MAKLFIRVDDRLIHGQIVTAWASNLGIKRIIAVDDSLASNQALKTIMMMGIPKDLNGQIVTSEEAKALLTDGKEDTTLLITRQCRNLANLLNEIKGATHLNLGNCSKQDKTVVTIPSGAGCTLSLTQEDMDTLNKLHDMGVEIFSQRVPTEKYHGWDEMMASKK